MICSSLLYAALSTMAEIPALYGQHPIVLRHQNAALYHPFIKSMALTLVDIPITFSTLVVFSVILYFLVRLQQSVGQFLYVFRCQLVCSLGPICLFSIFFLLASLYKFAIIMQSLWMGKKGRRNLSRTLEWIMRKVCTPLVPISCLFRCRCRP